MPERIVIDVAPSIPALPRITDKTKIEITNSIIVNPFLF